MTECEQLAVVVGRQDERIKALEQEAARKHELIDAALRARWALVVSSVGVLIAFAALLLGLKK